jgi:2-enoate reductase
MSFEKLFEPMKIGSVQLKNRVSMAPMGLSGLVTSEGGFTPRGVEYFVERARHGVGLLITGCAKVEHKVEPFVMPSQPNPTFNRAHFIQTSIEMTERIHAYGARIFLQMTFGFGRVVHPQTALLTPVSPSPVPNFWDKNIICRELATEEVEYLIESFAQAALVARESGFDGVEVHAVHEGYLLDQFTLPIFNHRSDKYGGSFENRMRVPIDLLKRTREAAGSDFPIMLRYGVKSYMKGLCQGLLPGEEAAEAGRDIEEGLKIAKILEEAGYDAFNADGGTYDSWYWAHPPMYLPEGCYLHLTELLKKTVKVPVIAAGKLGNPETAELALRNGRADGVSLGRPLLTDPEWVKKVRRGNVHDIRPCIGCHEACLKHIARWKPLSCAVNPQAGREVEYAFAPAARKRAVAIVGGGIAGMEAARVLTLRGHGVKLFEASEELGGHVAEASRPSFKEDDRRLLAWYKKQMEDLRVDVALNAPADAKSVEALGADAVIVATGSVPFFPPIPGLDVQRDPEVFSTREALTLDQNKTAGKKLGEKVAVIGGGLVGCELAYELHLKGREVVIVEALPTLMRLGDVAYPNKIMLLELLDFHKVKALTGVKVQKKEGDTLFLDDGSRLQADSVILATGYRSNDGLYGEISASMPEVYLVGDAIRPRNIKNAIWTAYEVARKL